MKKLVFLFGVLSLVFVSCNKDNNNDDGTPKEQELTYGHSLREERHLL